MENIYLNVIRPNYRNFMIYFVLSTTVNINYEYVYM